MSEKFAAKMFSVWCSLIVALLFSADALFGYGNATVLSQSTLSATNAIMSAVSTSAERFANTHTHRVLWPSSTAHHHHHNHNPTHRRGELAMRSLATSSTSFNRRPSNSVVAAAAANDLSSGSSSAMDNTNMQQQKNSAAQTNNHESFNENKKQPLHRAHSSSVVDGPDRAPSRAMLYAVGFTPEDFQKSQIGIASTWSNVTPCNMHLDRLARDAAAGADAAGGKAVIFNTITISDGIAMGTEGMRYSLVSREVIADSIETVVGCQGFDGLVVLGGCDKNMPAALMAIARLNRPAVFVYGGTILPGCVTGQRLAERLGHAQHQKANADEKNKPLDVVSVFEAVGAHSSGKIDDRHLMEVEACAIPGSGSCGGMYTANTMASAIEALGMSLPGSSAQDAVSKAKEDDSRRAGAAVLQLLKHAIRPRDIMTRRAFENAITVVIALGGSTNAVLHLLAMAHSAEVQLSIDDFTRIGSRVPVLADLKPSGRYLMSELVAIGGIAPLMRTLLDAGLLHGDCMTVTGKTLAENLADVRPYPLGQDIIRPLNNPIKPDSHLVIMRGNLAPGGAVAKISGKEGLSFTGRARVYDTEERAFAAIQAGEVVAGDVIVIRYEGPRGGPGMREMLSPTSAIMGRGLGKQVALITDGRFSGGSHGFVVGHITPEAYMGGPLAIVRDGDKITIDAVHRTIDIDLTERVIASRLAAWRKPAPRYQRGILAKYAAQVSSASEGAVTDKHLDLSNDEQAK